MKKRPAAKKPTARKSAAKKPTKMAKPAAKAAPTQTAKPAAKAAAAMQGRAEGGKYTPTPIQGIGWAPFRYPL
jgi:hypothetical protein